MRWLPLALMALSCTPAKSAPAPEPVTVPTASTAPAALSAKPRPQCSGKDLDVVALLGTNGCIAAGITAADAPEPDPRLVLRVEKEKGTCFRCTDLRVTIENPSAEPLDLYLAVEDGRFCASSSAPAVRGGLGSKVCTLVAGTVDGQRAVARLEIAPHGRARVDGLQFVANALEERSFPDSDAKGWFDAPFPPGRYTVQVTVPVAGTRRVAPVAVEVP
jgi:hypothetical protein